MYPDLQKLCQMEYKEELGERPYLHQKIYIQPAPLEKRSGKVRKSVESGRRQGESMSKVGFQSLYHELKLAARAVRKSLDEGCIKP
ncbi:hypothetical protein Trydic_g15798 [Trypoxylus dichotomus]